MEKQSNFTPESREKGLNIQMHVIFMRHGDKNENGELTDEGKIQSTEFGEKLENKDAIKVYSSPVKRVIETVEGVLEGAPHDKKLKTRIRTEIGTPPSSKEFIQKFKELEKQGADAAAEWYLNFGTERPDPETLSPHEVAESFAYTLSQYIKMTDRLYSDSNIDLINGTHQSLPEALLKEILIQQKDDKKIIGFDKLEDIGGALKFTESMEFLIKVDEKGNKTLKLNFRGQTYDLEMNKLNELAKSYEEKQKHE